MAEVRPRIVGSEMEYPISIRYAGEDEFQVFDYPTPRGIRVDIPRDNSEGMLGNGGRIYWDVGHVEYCTAEETTFEGLLKREIAGERIVSRYIAQYVADNPEVSEAHIRKRVVDDLRRTWGYHISLSADRHKIETTSDKTLHMLALHIATSQALFGGGAILKTPNTDPARYYYSFGQKALGLTMDYSTGTINGSKPLINQRDEPLAKTELYRRIHITSMDAHVSPWAVKMSVGSCSLVLRAIEQGLGGDLRIAYKSFDELIRVAQASALDLGFTGMVQLENDNRVSHLEIQQRIINLVKKTDHTDEEDGILREWQQAVDDLREDPRLLFGRSDAITRLYLIRDHLERKGLDPSDMSSSSARAIDTMYDRIFEVGTRLVPADSDDVEQLSRQRLIAHKLRMGTMAHSMATNEAIEDAVHNPPTTTRAYRRGTMIQDNPGVIGTKWDRFLVNGVTTTLPDPYDDEYFASLTPEA